VLARSADEVAEAAERFGRPVAIKLVSASITHKSEVGGVVLDVRGAAEAAKAFRAMERRLREHDLIDQMTGVMIQPMIEEGVEAIIGVAQDPQFGPLVMFGLGGVYVELLKDVVFRIHPLTDRDASEMVREVRGFKLLEGYRGSPPGDIPALEQALLRVSQLIEDHPRILEMDLNPLMVLPPGRGCLAVDARISVGQSE
jgi:acyl-CoA synthetase (NDP forming)